MLALLAWPIYAVCGCDEPGGMPCCDPTAVPTAEVKPVVIELKAEAASCCSAEAEPVPAAETCSTEMNDDDLAYATTGCEQDVISANLPMANLPSKPVAQDTDGTVAVALVAAVPATTTHSAHTRDHRAPPTRPVAAFILNATFLI